MLRAIALDDEPLPLEILSTFCGRMSEEINLLKTFSKIQEARKFLEAEDVDLIFLDIQMPMLSGIEFYQLFGKNKLLIFTTAFSDFAIQGFELDAVDYLLKPFDFARFQKAIEKAQRLHKTQVRKDTASIWVRVDSNQVRIALENIQYIEAMADYLRIHLSEGKAVVTRMTVKNMQTQLNTDFARIHKSFIIRKDQVTAHNSREVYIQDIKLPIGASYSGEFDLG